MDLIFSAVSTGFSAIGSGDFPLFLTFGMGVVFTVMGATIIIRLLSGASVSFGAKERDK